MASRLKDYAALVALPHSVFALPFALAAFLYAYQANKAENIQGNSPIFTLLLVVCAAIGARTAAMAFNRIIDRDIDKINPRTSLRELPAGKIEVSNAKVLCFLASVVFLISSALIGYHCLVLAPAVLTIVLGYSYTKRFTSLSHLVLGLCLALAPGGAWWALRPTVEALPLTMMVAVLLWVAGFDVLYSCQDVDFDRRSDLYSIPSKIGVTKALKLSFFLHIAAFLMLISTGYLAGLGMNYYVGMGLIGSLFVGQHWLIKPDDLSRINHSFFTFNGVLSLAYFLVVVTTLP
jgi:4-hydroxybenzoate polyprenyltransferase